MITGQFTEADIAQIDRVTRELSRQIDSIKVYRVDQQVEANVVLMFAPRQVILDSIAYSGPPTVGWRYVETDQWIIEGARIWIASDVPDDQRLGAIREEITQILGLRHDSPSHVDSIFYSGSPKSFEMFSIDETIIRLLYEEEIRPGMTVEDLEELGL